MAEMSHGPTMNDCTDFSEPSRNIVATGMAGLRGKITKFDLLKQLYQSAFDKREKAAAEFEEADIEFQNMKIACSQLSDELRALKENSPEASPILSDFTPFEDIPQTAAAPLLAASSPEPQHSARFSVTERILKAAGDMENLEDRNELMKVMLQEKTDEVEKLKQELKHSETDLNLQQEKISQLNAEIAKLKAGMSPEGSSATLSPAGEVQLMKRFDSLHASTSPSELSLADDVAMDPAVMQAKIKELTSRISELLNHNFKWKQQCDGLMRELESVKRQLVEYQQLTEIKLLEEREKTNRAVAERDDALAEVERQREEKQMNEDMCRQLTEDVARLEATVHDLECRDLQSIDPDEEMKSERLAYKFQIEELQSELEAERQSHERTKANKDSLAQQWKNIHEQLMTKTRQLKEAKAEMERLQNEHRKCSECLKQANSDKELIKESLGEYNSRAGEARMSSGDVVSGGQQASRLATVSSKAKPSRSALEEDRPMTVTEVRGVARSEPCNAWTCDVCSYYNSGSESLNACKVCSSKRGKLVSYPVQESRATSTYGDQGFLTSFKAMSCSSSISRVGRSKLEEDGVTSCVPHVVY